MKFSHVLRYDAPPAEVHAMLSDPAFREQVCAAGGALRQSVTVEPTGAGMEVVVDQTLPAEGIPAFAQKFVGHEIHVVQRESWSSSEGGTLDVAIPGKPGHLKGTVALAAERDGSATVQTVAGEIKVHIPLVGGKLEALIGDLLASALRNEERVGKGWLAGRR